MVRGFFIAPFNIGLCPDKDKKTLVLEDYRWSSKKSVAVFFCIPIRYLLILFSDWAQSKFKFTF